MHERIKKVIAFTLPPLTPPMHLSPICKADSLHAHHAKQSNAAITGVPLAILFPAHAFLEPQWFRWDPQWFPRGSGGEGAVSGGRHHDLTLRGRRRGVRVRDLVHQGPPGGHAVLRRLCVKCPESRGTPRGEEGGILQGAVKHIFGRQGS
jgi:hypothetical protein